MTRWSASPWQAPAAPRGTPDLRARGPRAVPRLEPLEDRILPSITPWSPSVLLDPVAPPSAPALVAGPDGGAGGYDTLILEGGRFARTGYEATGPDAGTLSLDDEVTHFTGLEPIDDNNVIADRVFTDTTTGDGQQIRLTDDGDLNNGNATI